MIAQMDAVDRGGMDDELCPRAGPRTSSALRTSPCTNSYGVCSGCTSNKTGSCPASDRAGASAVPSVPPAPVIKIRILSYPLIITTIY